MLRDVLAQDKLATAELRKLTVTAKTTLTDIFGIAERAAVELLVETGDVRRVTEAGVAKFNGTAPIPASSGEGAGDPVRHRLSRGGNRRINAVLHRIAMIQPRCDPRARQLGRTLRRWHDHIVAWHRARVSNGPTEAVNNLIKRIKRIGFGFRRFAHYRLRVLLYAGRPNWDLLATLDPAQIR